VTPFLAGGGFGREDLPWSDSAVVWRTLLHELPVGVVVLDRDGRVAAYNRAESELAGTRPGDVIGRDFFGEVAPCAEVQELAGAVRAALDDPDAELDRELDFRFEFDDGGLDVRIRMRELRLEGEPCVVLVIEDTTRLKETERSLQEALEKARDLARRDPLTGLGNRRWFEERLAAEVRRAGRYGHPVSLMVADVDRFKEVNDRRGHAAGDAVLEALGEAFRDGLRESDQAFRVGVEEFCLLLPHTDSGEAVRVADRVHRRVERVEVGEAPGLELSVSVGVADTAPIGTPDQGGDGWRETGERLWGRADDAMYRAKEAGRARTEVDDSPEA
jgi:photoactive yellow protein